MEENEKDTEEELLNGEKQLAENMVLDFLCNHVELEGQGIALIEQSKSAAVMVKRNLRGKDARNSSANKLTGKLLGEFQGHDKYKALEGYLQGVYTFWEAYYEAKRN